LSNIAQPHFPLKRSRLLRHRLQRGKSQAATKHLFSATSHSQLLLLLLPLLLLPLPLLLLPLPLLLLLLPLLPLLLLPL
jgi:hypothetical protein